MRLVAIMKNRCKSKENGQRIFVCSIPGILVSFYGVDGMRKVEEDR